MKKSTNKYGMQIPLMGAVVAAATALGTAGHADNPVVQTSFTDHPGVVDYKRHTYLFYHNGDLCGGGGFHRSVCVDEMKFNPDGSIVQMNMTIPRGRTFSSPLAKK